MLAPGFVLDGVANELLELLVRAAFSHGCLEIYLTVDHEAGTEAAVCRQPQPVAGVTEIVAHGADETNDPFGTLQPEKPGRPL
jgi:hypothetical protein